MSRRPSPRIRQLSVGAAAACLVALLGAAPASAVVIRLASGRYLSYLPTRQSRPHPPADQLLSNLDYGGGPVMPSNTNYTVYWRPPGGPAYPPDYQSGLNQYFADLAHDSGRPSNVDSVAAQLNDTFGNLTSYRSSFGGALIDTDPYPPSGCPNAAICLTDTQVTAELGAYIDAHHLPRDLAHEYFLLTPPGVANCFDAAGTICSVNAFPNPGYCAYHGASPTPPFFVYANDPYVTGNFACDDGNHPNGTTADGALQGGLSHEHVESITDPLPNSSWTDWATGFETGYEIGDKCEFGPLYGDPLGVAPNGASFNQVINGHRYWYQEEWSNQGHTCLQRFTPVGQPPIASFTSGPGSGLTLNFDAGRSTGGIVGYSWQFNDAFPPFAQQETSGPTVSHTFPAPGAYVVALTVFAADGASHGTARVVLTGDEGPNPAVSVAPDPGLAGRPMAFSGAPSSDPDGAIAAYLWNFGDASPLATGATPSHTFAAAGTYRVTLTVLDTSHQRASTTVPVTVAPAADLVLAKSASPSPAIAGQQLTYTLTVKNHGPSTAAQARIVDPLPAGQSFQGASPACTYAAGAVTCELGDLAAGASATALIVVLPGPGRAVNTATVSSPTADPDPTNNTASATTVVGAACDSTLTGRVPGSVVVAAGQSLCLSGASVAGSVTVRAGAALQATASTIGGGLTAVGARFVTVCGSTIDGATLIADTGLMVRVGDDDAGCASNQLGSGLSLSGNQAGLEVFANEIAGSVQVRDNRGASPAADAAPEIEGNRIGARLTCSGNVPPATDDGLANHAGGGSAGECAGLT